MAASPIPDRLQQWEKKYQKAEDDLIKLKTSAVRAVQEYDALAKKYADTEVFSQRLADELKNTQDELAKLSNVSEAVITDYNDLKVNLEVEEECRKEAETFASKVVKENKDIKRKSQAIFMQANVDVKLLDISLDEDDDDNSDSVEVIELKKTVDELREQLIKCKQESLEACTQRDDLKELVLLLEGEVGKFNNQYETEKLEHQMSKQLLAEHDRTIEQFTRVNTVVYKELEELKAKYEQEQILREEAEKYASQREQETTAMKRQSAILMLSVENEERLKEALTEVERLTAEMEKEKHESAVKIKALEEELATSADIDNINALEEKLSITVEENEKLEQRAINAERSIHEMEAKIKKLEVDLEKALLKPVPPPPPPPPPPPSISSNPLSALRAAIGKKKHPPPSVKPMIDAHPCQDAINEMITRIKKGVPLRSVNSTSSPTRSKKSEAIQELGDMLNSLKKKQLVNDLTRKPTHRSGADPQLMERLQRRRLKTDGDLADDSPPPPVDAPRRASCNPPKSVPIMSEEYEIHTGGSVKRKPPPPPQRAQIYEEVKSETTDTGEKEGQNKEERSDTKVEDKKTGTKKLSVTPETDELYDEPQIPVVDAIYETMDEKEDHVYGEADEKSGSGVVPNLYQTM